MMLHSPDSAPTNPFCASRLRPGAIDYIFEHGMSLRQLVDALETNHWRGEIIGRHGTGKSTLLAALIHDLEARGRIVKSLTLGAGQRSLPTGFLTSLRLTAGQGVAAVDGIEQLNAWNRLRLRHCCNRYTLGLIVTSHRSTRLPTIYQTKIDVPLAWKVVARLLEGFAPLVGISDLVEQLTRRRGNLREALFDLYDLYETRHRGP